MFVAVIITVFFSVFNWKAEGNTYIFIIDIKGTGFQ